MKKKTSSFCLALVASILAIACSDGDASTSAQGDGDEMSTEGTDDGAPVTSALPAACESSADCPDGIECVMSDGATVGYCNVEETTVSPGESGPSLGAPAPCADDSECPDGIECSIREGEAVGFCNMSEQIVEAGD